MLQSKMTDSILSVEKKGDSTLLHVRSLDGKERYVRLKETQIESRTIVLAEDVTTSTLERLRIERERDYDLLTGLYNRRAFYRFAGRLFDRPDKMKHAAVVMMDLDNLKRTNDTFGHEWGDRYIHEAAVCFLLQHSGWHALRARIRRRIQHSVLRVRQPRGGAARNRQACFRC